MNKPIIFLDMDETVVALSEYIVKQYNNLYNDNMKWTDNHSYWWSDCKKADKDFFVTLLQTRGTFLNPKPMEGCIEVINKLHDEGYDIHIITLPQWKSYFSTKEKVEWIEKYLPFINIDTNFHCTNNKGLLAKEDRILIDDNPRYLKNWEDHGGISICFNYNFCYDWSKNWIGEVVPNWECVYERIKEIERGCAK